MGSPFIFGDDCFNLCPRRYSSTQGARHLPSATTTSAFALVDIVRLEGLVVHLRRRLLRPSPSSIQFDLRDSPSIFGDDCFDIRPRRYSSTRGARSLPSATTTSAFALSIQFDSRGSLSTFGNDYFSLHPRRYSSTRVARRLPSVTITLTFALVNTVRLEGLTVQLRRGLLQPSALLLLLGGVFSPTTASPYWSATIASQQERVVQ